MALFGNRSFLVKMVRDTPSGPVEEDVFDDIKTHFEKYKAAYIVGGVGVVAAGFTWALMRGGVPMIPGAPNSVVDGPVAVTVRPTSLFSNRMTTTTNTVITTLERRGHPVWIVKCKETGELFASQNRAAEACGITAPAISQHLNGLKDQAGGLHFERIGEAI
jgi:hypothetical protein